MNDDTLSYAALIDPTDFGTVAAYLRNPRSPINYLVHVRSYDMLAPLAAELAHVDPRTVPPWEFPEPVARRLPEGSLLLSARYPLHRSEPKQLVEATAVSRQASCQVIYLPPYYLVHTPGLFEGTLVRQAAAVDQGPAQRRALGFRMKP